MEKKFGALSSSADSSKLSLAIKGALLGLLPIAVVILKMNGIEILEADLVNVVNGGIAFIASGQILFGLGRKIFVAIKK